MHAFEYHRPANAKDAVALSAKNKEGRYLAGGQSLVQAMKLRPSRNTRCRKCPLPAQRKG